MVFVLITEAVAKLVDGAIVFDQIQNSEFIIAVAIAIVVHHHMCLITEDERPSMKDLYRYVVYKYASEWNDIAIELGLEASIKIIETENQTCKNRLKETLQKWLDLSPNVTWKTLEVAITNVKRAKMSLDPITDIYGENIIV